MFLSCKYCGHLIDFHIKIAAEDFLDEYNQSVENFHAQTMGPLTYQKEQDPQGWAANFLSKHKKKYPGKKDVIPEEDDIGVSTVAQLKDGFIAKCGECQSIYIYDRKEADVKDPSSNDVYHNDNYRNNPDKIFPSGHSNIIGEDFDKVNSNTDCNIEKIVRKIKYRNNKEKKNEDNQ